ncbi:hypothetical protein C2E23DRAFT_703481, partial [Lenzites betulinus]
GPRLPNRVNETEYARYCRLMLILFVPWRNVSDLKQVHESWPDAFTRCQATMNKEHLDVMSNMQMVAECKVSRDD